MSSRLDERQLADGTVTEGFMVAASGTGTASWVSIITIQTGDPTGDPFTTPLIYDNTAVTGGLYAFDGSDYVKIGGLI